jgi:threonine dehydratase
VSGPTARTHPEGRLAWADGVKAFSIVLVVVGHAIGFMIAANPATPAQASSIWYTFALAIVPIRVPLFFVISGYFAVQAIARPWRSSFRRRIGDTAWTYALWLAFLVAFFTCVLPFPLAEPDYVWPEYLAQLLVPVNHLWYLWALVAYFVIAKASIRINRNVTLIVALGLNVTSAEPWQPLPDNVVRNLLFFLIGAYLPSVIGWCGARWRFGPVVVAIATYSGLALVAMRFELGEVPAVMTLMSVFGIFATIQLIRSATQLGAVRRLGLWLGARTQSIYVTHIPLLTVVSALSAMFTAESSGAGPLMFLFPVAAAALVILAAVAFDELMRRTRAQRFIFRGPWNWHASRSTSQVPAPDSVAVIRRESNG